MQIREQELKGQALSAQARASELEQQLAQQAEALKRQGQDMAFSQRVHRSAQWASYMTHAMLVKQIPGLPDHARRRLSPDAHMLSCLCAGQLGSSNTRGSGDSSP